MDIKNDGARPQTVQDDHTSGVCSRTDHAAGDAVVSPWLTDSQAATSAPATLTGDEETDTEREDAVLAMLAGFSS